MGANKESSFPSVGSTFPADYVEPLPHGTPIALYEEPANDTRASGGKVFFYPWPQPSDG